MADEPGLIPGRERCRLRATTLAAARPALAIVALATGCYASHDLGGERERCGEVGEPSGWPCDAEPTAFAAPHGVCALDDGSLVAFFDSSQDVVCTPGEGPGLFELAPIHCAPEGPLRRAVARCGDAGASATFRRWPVRPPIVSDRYDLSRAQCAISDQRVAEPVEPWRPFLEATELCDDPHAWCGSPIVLELRTNGGDQCNGREYTERCDAAVEDGRVVLRAEVALARVVGGCEAAEGDHVATCVVPPLPAGRHEVVDGRGRFLGTIEIPAVPPVGDLEPTCAPIP